MNAHTWARILQVSAGFRLADIAARGSERAQFFSWDRVSQRVLSYYERLAFEKGLSTASTPKVEA